jgi:sulfite exporter TauE/SafE
MNTNSLPLLLSILLAAFLGSWHCALMCGPLCISISNRGSLWPYHLGRVIGYSIAGAIAGALGQRLLWHQNSLVQGASMVFVGLAFLWLALDLFQNKTSQISKKIWKVILSIKTRSRFVLGLLSIFLPCGWLFYFLLAAAATQSPTSGALVLFLLWLSGLPALAGTTWLMRDRMQKVHPQQQRIATVIMTLAGMYALFAHYLF